MGIFDDLLPAKPEGSGGLFDDLLPQKKRSSLMAVNDTVIEGANAVAGGVKSLADFVSPGNRVSQFIDENIIKAGEEAQTDVVKAEKRRLAEETQNADGMLGEAGAALGYVARNPVLAAAQAVGSFVAPGAAIKGAGGLARLAGAGAAGVTTAGTAGGVAAGAALSGGDAAGQAYELVIRAGGSEQQAQDAARQASVIPALVGGATGAFGAEKLFAGGKGFAGGAMSRALKTGASEAGQEALEEGVTQYEGQRAAMPYDSSIDPMKGVAGAATLGAALGGITGAGVSLLQGAPASSPAPSPADAQKAEADAALGSIGSAQDIDQALASFTKAVPPPMSLMSAPAPDPNSIDFEADPRFAGAPTFDNGAAPSQPVFGSKQAADIHIGEAGALGEMEPFEVGGGKWSVRQTEAAANAAAQANIEQWMKRAQPMPQERAQEIVQTAAETQNKAMTAIPMPDGTGWTVVPSKWVSAPILADYMEQATAASQAEAEKAARKAAAAAAPVDRAPRTGSAQAVEVKPADPVASYIAQQRATNTPAARAYVAEFDAGRVTPAEVQKRIARETPRTDAQVADERLAAAAAQAPAVPEGALLTSDGFPYGTRSGAVIRARREGLEPSSVIEVAGGYAVRTKEPTNDQPDVPGTPALAAGASDGRSDPAVGSGVDLRPDAPVDGGMEPAAANPAPSSGTTGAVGDGSGADGALTPAANESDQDRSNREWRENYEAVVSTDDLNSLSPARIRQAINYAAKRFTNLQPAAWEGDQAAKDQMTALDRERGLMEFHLKTREGQPTAPLRERVQARKAAAAAPADASNPGAAVSNSQPESVPPVSSVPAEPAAETVAAASGSDAAVDTSAGRVDSAAGNGQSPATLKDRVQAMKTAARNSRHPKTVMGSDLLAAMSSRLGGLDPSWLSEFSTRFETARKGKDGRALIQWRNPMIPGVGKLFRRGGTQDLQQIAEVAEDMGYLDPGTVERDAKEAGELAKGMIRAALNRQTLQTADERIAEEEAGRKADEEAYYAELDAESAREAEAEREAIMAEAEMAPREMDEMDDDIPWDVVASDQSTEEAMRAMGFSEEEIADELAKETLSREEGGRPEAAAPAAGKAAPASAARSASPGAEEGLTLEAQTPADLKAKADREEGATDAERKKKAAEQERLRREAEQRDNRARADQTVGDFQLGQDADAQMSGMGDMFAEPASPPAPAEAKAPAKPKSDAPVAAKIDNFGEALPPGRRTMAAKLDEELSDSDIANRPLSEIWPLAENEAIEDTFAAAVAHAARAEIPAKPRVAYKLRRWVQSVKTVRELTAHVLSGRLSRERLMEEVKGPRATLRDWAAKVMLLEKLPREQWKRIGEVEERPDAFTYADGGKQVPMPTLRLVIDDKPHYLRGDGTTAGNIDEIRALLGDSAPEKRMEFEIRGVKPFRINKKGDGQYRTLGTFQTVAEARKAITDDYAGLVAAWEAVKARDNITERDLRTEENRNRAGKDWREGKDVSAEQFQEQFGFKGGEFGKWVQQGKGDKERQALLNNTFDALMDLAQIAGIPPRAISLNGTLGIAFGSRGTGWASAHFEPSNLVINLTKTRGAGALAHEWFHAVDNYFSRMRGGEAPMSEVKTQKGYRDSNFITHKPEQMMVRIDGRWPAMSAGKLEALRRDNPTSVQYAAEKWQRDPKHPAGVRPEVEQRFADLVQALNNSPMTKRARELDGTKTGEGYWSQTLERAARAFENYVQARMHEDGYHNDFLANVRPVEDTGRNPTRYPYLLPGEIKPVADAFGALFSEIQTKTDDSGNVAMFSRSKPADDADTTPGSRAAEADKIELRKRLSVLKSLKGCLG